MLGISDPAAQRTLVWETARATLVRPAEVAAGSSGVLLLVAIQHFDAGPTAKALLASAAFVGMLASPLPVAAAAVRGVSVRKTLATLMFGAGSLMAVAGLGSELWLFVASALVGVTLLHSSSPLVTDLWRRNVPDAARGGLFGLVSSISGLFGIVSALLIAEYLGDDVGRYRPALIVLGLLLGLAGWASMRMPRHHLDPSARLPLPALSLLWTNRRFGVISAAWMLVGLGNLATIPLRTEYIASGAFLPAYSARAVVLMTIVLPQTITLITSPLWGRLFDRVNFLHLRIGLNLVFALSIVTYFTPSIAGQIAGSALLGIGMGGGHIAWSLWVTRYSDEGRTADYMAVHTFLTGVRGLAAPFLAYAALEGLSLQSVVNVGTLLVLLATALVGAIVAFDRRRRGREDRIEPG